MRDHTSLHAWQEARSTALRVLELCRTHWAPYGAALFSQLQRSAISVQLNIAEGYTFTESRTFTRHLGIAYGSAVETGEILSLLIESGIIAREDCLEAVRANSRCQRLLLGMLKKRRPASS
jgi:four helix bundle protein